MEGERLIRIRGGSTPNSGQPSNWSRAGDYHLDIPDPATTGIHDAERQACTRPSIEEKTGSARYTGR
jgi:hypothetical protein